MWRKKGSIKYRKRSAGEGSEERQREVIRALENMIYEKKLR